MKTRVYEYTLQTTEVQDVDLPQGAELLCVEFQKGELRLWARVVPNHPSVCRRLRVVATGDVEAPGRYVGSAIPGSGTGALHVFDQGEVPNAED